MQADGSWRQPPLGSIDLLIASSASRELSLGQNRVSTTEYEASLAMPQYYGLMGCPAKSADPRGRLFRFLRTDHVPQSETAVCY